MAEQLEMKGVLDKMEHKNEVFYVRCRPSVKKALVSQMSKDGFESMADWFEQFVSNAFMKKPLKKKAKKK